MKVLNKRGLIIGTTTAVLAIICFAAYFNYSEQRFMISGALLIALSAVNLIRAFSKKGVLEELAENADERDLYLVMKSSHLVIKIMNYVICCFTFVFIILYAIYKFQYFVIIAGTLCGVLVMMFIVLLVVSVYLEKRE